MRFMRRVSTVDCFCLGWEGDYFRAWDFIPEALKSPKYVGFCAASVVNCSCSWGVEQWFCV